MKIKKKILKMGYWMGYIEIRWCSFKILDGSSNAILDRYQMQTKILYC
jgi:hypothetical protein